MPSGFSTNVKSSSTSVFSSSTRRNVPSIIPAFGAVQHCSATRGPQAPSQRPSSQAKLASPDLGSAAGAEAEAAGGAEGEVPAPARFWAGAFDGINASKASMPNGNNRDARVLMGAIPPLPPGAMKLLQENIRGNRKIARKEGIPD